MICDLINSSKRITVDERAANARLIAAAPELLWALEVALGDLEQAQAETHIDLRASIDAVQSAIAKATGQTT